jgi:hypothetical protein
VIGKANRNDESGLDDAVRAPLVLFMGLLLLLAIMISVLALQRARIASAATVTVEQSAHADLDGDLRRDLVTVRRDPGPPAPITSVDVQLATGRVVSSVVRTGPGHLSLVKVGNIDGRAGDELLLTRPEDFSSEYNVRILTYYGHALHLVKQTFKVGTPNVGIQYGVTCSFRRGQHFITQQHVLNSTLKPNHRTLDEHVYVWKKGELHSYSTSKPRHIKDTQLQAPSLKCGHRPAA